MLKIEGKTFMNIQEAVQWLLDNNALPFQSSANYIANTEIGMGTIVNPSPAKVRIGSLIFFADSKVSTVTGLTENGFIVSDQYNDLVDDVVYVSNVALNASGHLIVTLSNGDVIDAGLIKQVTSFAINASQHLIVTYNDGTSADLGAIFAGNITISGDLTVTGTFDADSVPMSKIKDANQRSRFIEGTITTATATGVRYDYARWSLSGTHLMIVLAGKIDANAVIPAYSFGGSIAIPDWLGNKIVPIVNRFVDGKTTFTTTDGYSHTNNGLSTYLYKDSNIQLSLSNQEAFAVGGDSDEYFRIEYDLLIDNA